jgi:hypothetical protein
VSNPFSSFPQFSPKLIQHFTTGVGNATLAQFRILGGTFAISIATAAATPFISSRLLHHLSPTTVQTLLDRTEGIVRLPEELQGVVRHIFADGYNLQMRILIGIAAAHVPATLLMWTRKGILISRTGAGEVSTAETNVVSSEERTEPTRQEEKPV